MEKQKLISEVTFSIKTLMEEIPFLKRSKCSLQLRQTEKLQLLKDIKHTNVSKAYTDETEVAATVVHNASNVEVFEMSSQD